MLLFLFLDRFLGFLTPPLLAPGDLPFPPFGGGPFFHLGALLVFGVDLGLFVGLLFGLLLGLRFADLDLELVLDFVDFVVDAGFADFVLALVFFTPPDLLGLALPLRLGEDFAFFLSALGLFFGADFLGVLVFG